MSFSLFSVEKSSGARNSTGEWSPSSGLVGVVLTELSLRKRREWGRELGPSDGPIATLRPEADAGTSVSLLREDDDGGAGRSFKRRLSV